MDSLTPAAREALHESELLSFVRTLALGFSLAVAVALPAVFLYLNYANLAGRVEMMAQIKAGSIAALASGDPQMWKYNYVRMDEMLRRNPIDLTNERITVRDIAGNAFLIVGAPPPVPTLTFSSPVYDFGREVGHVEIAHSYRGMVFGTLAAAALGLLVGVTVFAASTLPLRALQRTSNALAAKQAELSASEGYRALFDRASDGIMTLTPSGRLVAVNEAFAQMHGYSKDEILAINPNDLDASKSKHLIGERMQRVLSGEVLAFEVEHYHKDGHVFPLEVSTSLISLHGGPLIQALHRDITERKQMEEQVRQLVLYDQLTNLPNRRLLGERLGQAMATNRRSGCYGAMMFLDLDNFKLLNDTHGHEVGDQLLIEAAVRMKGCVRETDTVARFGGDEFVVMLSKLNVDESESTIRAGIIAEKIRAALGEPYVLNIRHDGQAIRTVEHHCTASIGVALFSKHETSQEDILKRADTVMYQAKEAGRNLIRFYDSNGRVTAEETKPVIRSS